MRFLFILLLLASPVLANDSWLADSSQKNGTKPPVPNASELIAPRQDVEEIFGERIKNAKLYSSKAKIARDLLKVVPGAANRFEKFALLDQARKLAVEAKNLQLLLETVNMTDKNFQVDRLKLTVDGIKEIAGRRAKENELEALVKLDWSAQSDFTKVNDAAEAWDELATKTGGYFSRSVRDYAITYYKLALPKMSGLRKLRAQKRIEELERRRGSQAKTPSEIIRQKNQFIIHKAIYGSGNHNEDVTQRFAWRIYNTNCCWATNDELQSDPAYGWVKRLDVTYSVNGKTKHATFREGKLVTINQNLELVGAN